MTTYSRRKNILIVFESRGILHHHHQVFEPDGKILRKTQNKMRGVSMRFETPEENVVLLSASKPTALLGLSPDYCVVVGDLAQKYIDQIAAWECPVEELLVRNGTLCEMPKDRTHM